MKPFNHFFQSFMTDAALIVSIMIPLVFLIGSCLIYLYRRKMEYGELLIQILEYIVQMSSVVLIISYLCLLMDNSDVLFRIWGILIFPSAFYLLVSAVADYQTLLTVILISLEISIVSSTKITFAIVICVFYIIFHCVIYFLKFQINKIILDIEKSFAYTLSMTIYSLFLIIFEIIINIFINIVNLSDYLLLSIGIIFVIFAFTLPLEKEYKKIIRFKLILSVFILMDSISAYCSNLLTFNIITPILCFVVPFIFEIVFLKIKINLSYGRVLNSNNDFTYEGDIYELNWSTRTAKLKYKGEIDDFIISHFYIKNIKFNVVELKENCFGLNIESLTIQNTRLPIDCYNAKRIKIDYNSHYKVVSEIIKRIINVQKIDLTENCRSLVSNDNKIYSIHNMMLCFGPRNILHLTIIESCKFVNDYACKNCKNLKFVVFPSSLKEI